MCDLSMVITSTPAAASIPTPSGLELADALRYALDAQMDDPTDVDKIVGAVKHCIFHFSGRSRHAIHLLTCIHAARTDVDASDGVQRRAG
jgi:hypothetical protein